MSSVSGIKAGRAYVAIGADDSELRNVLRKTEQRLNATAKTIRNIGSQMVVAGGAVAGGLLAAAVSAGKLGDHLNDLNAKTGIGVEALAGLDIAASTSGSSLDALAGDIFKMNRVVGEAAGGSKSAADALASLGLTLADLQGLSPDKQFGIFADRIAAIPDPAGRAAAATKIFGRASGDLMPILMQGSRGLKEFQAQADALGVTLAYKTASGVGEFDDALARTRKQIEAVKVTIGAAIAQALLPYEKSVADALKRTIEWVAHNSQFIVSIGKMAAEVAAGGIALLGLSTALNVTAKAVRTVSVALKLLNTNPIIAVASVVATVAAALILNEKLIAAQNMKVMISLNEYTQANDEARASDIERLAGLKKLSDAGKLSDEQMGEARGLVAQLETNYGALGITIDKTTGQIVGMADAWDKVTAAMGTAAKADIQKQLQSVDEEFSRLEKDFREINDDWFDGLARLDATSGNIPLNEPGSPKSTQSKKPPKIVQDNIDAQNTLLEKRRELNRRLKEIDDRTTNALTGGAQPVKDLVPNFSPIVTGLEDVGDAAVESGSKVSRWADLLRMAQEMFRKQKAGEEFLLDLSVSHARATGNDVFADSLETVREFREALDGLQSHPFLTDAQKKWAGATALDAAEANLERIREGLSEVNLRTFSAGVFNSNAISSLNRAGNSGKSFEANQKKQISLLEESRNWLRTIAQKEGLIFGP